MTKRVLLIASLLAAFLAPTGLHAQQEKEQEKEQEREQEKEQEITVKLSGGATMEMVYIEPGTFMMGSSDSVFYPSPSERPQHEVTISQGFYLGKYEVTQGEWQGVMGSNPSHYSYKGDNRPVETVSGNDVQEFIDKLNQAAGSELYRLPTEAEWEYACRAGTTTWWSFGEDEGLLGDYAWYGGNNSPFGTKEVGKKQANPWGLYDMHGNVYEWCQDWWGLYSSDAQIDPAGSSSGSSRIIRGGYCGSHARYVRSAYRLNLAPSYRYHDVGFRLLRRAD